MTALTRLEGSAGRYSVTLIGGDYLGDVIHDDYGGFGGDGWAAVTQRNIDIADPVYTIGAQVYPTRRQAVAALLRDAGGFMPMQQVQVVHITDTCPESEEYGDWRGYAVETNGQYRSGFLRLTHAINAAAQLTGTAFSAWTEDEMVDGRGLRTWSNHLS